MKYILHIVVLSIILYNNGLSAQKSSSCSLIFKPVFGNQDFNADSYYKLGKDSVLIETLKFYVSQLELLQNGKTVYEEKNSYHLMDFSNSKTSEILLAMAGDVEFNQLKLSLGIDSVTNVSGALGGDLDPTKGMYWTWQSGYVNFKLEGKSNLCNTRHHEFQFHLGGYQQPFNCFRSIILNVVKNEKQYIVIDIEQFIKEIDLSKLNHIMSPSANAILLSEQVLKTIHVSGYEK